MKKLFLSAALAAAFIAPASAAEVTLKIAHFLPSAAPAQRLVMEPWCADLNQASNGRIECQFYPAMQLGGTPGQLADQALRGVADIVWTAPGYSAGRFPVIEAMELPFVVRNATSGSKAAWTFLQKYAQDEFSKYHVLGIHVDGGVALHTANREIKGLNDIKGLKLRTPTRMASKTLAALGGEPVSMPPGQVTEAIAKGVVDGAMGAWEVVMPTKLDEVTKYHTQPAAGETYPSATVLIMLMNKEKYESLPADLKQIVDERSGLPLVERFGFVFDDIAAKTRARVEASGGQVIDISETDLSAMKNAARPVDQEWRAEMDKKGLNGTELSDAARALARE
ncbi:TRAP transporter substrate-binding protein [Castellaniella sp.]|uniref:TRAP transporter substrate-binding protein n=1 Tax=Castellaniella sp. TaxID=1955812 RepID=UPI002B0010FC|nr:TRAP transporter substrate-binding protein [Castellaniella sp.]